MWDSVDRPHIVHRYKAVRLHRLCLCGVWGTSEFFILREARLNWIVKQSFRLRCSRGIVTILGCGI